MAPGIICRESINRTEQPARRYNSALAQRQEWSRQYDYRNHPSAREIVFVDSRVEDAGLLQRPAVRLISFSNPE